MAFLEQEEDTWTSQKVDCPLSHCVPLPPVLPSHLTAFGENLCALGYAEAKVTSFVELVFLTFCG